MILTILFFIGLIAEAATGALAAARERMDLFGVVVIATMTALGGGSIRDVLLGHYPLSWVKNPDYLLIVGSTAIIAVSVPWLMQYFSTLFLVLDAVGLSVFTVIGANIALSMGYGVIIAATTALITGVMGGILRDILCNRVPLVFHKELYAIVVLIGVAVYLTLREFGVSEDVRVTISLLVTFTVRLLAIYFKLGLPILDYQERHYTRPDFTRLWSRPGSRSHKKKKKKVLPEDPLSLPDAPLHSSTSAESLSPSETAEQLTPLTPDDPSVLKENIITDPGAIPGNDPA